MNHEKTWYTAHQCSACGVHDGICSSGECICNRGGGTDPESGVSEQAEAPRLEGGETIDDAYVAEHGNTFAMSGEYAKNVKINTSGNVTIKITGVAEYSGASGTDLLSIAKVGTLTVNNLENYKIECKGEKNGFLRCENGTVIVEGGDYYSYHRETLFNHGNMTLNKVNACADSENAFNNWGVAIINGGTYQLINTTQGYSTIYNRYASTGLTLNNVTVHSCADGVFNQTTKGKLIINGGEYTTDNSEYNSVYTVPDSTTEIHGGTFMGTGTVIWNRGAMTIDNTADKTKIGVTGDSTGLANVGVLNTSKASFVIDGATIENTQYGIWKKTGTTSVTLNDASFKNNENDIYLDEGETITIADGYTKRTTVKVAEDAITEPRELTTTGTQTLNLVSHNEGYYVAYDETNRYYVLNKRSEGKYIVNAECATATAADGTVLDANMEIDPGTKVTLTADDPDEGWVFTGWQVTKPAEGLTELEGTEPTVTFTMPESDVAVSAQYEYVGVSDDSSGIAGAIVAGGALVWVAYEAGTGIYRTVNMRGIPLPSDRAELALLIWEKADKPEPESAELYSDIDEDDTDLQKAARWMVEQELMKDQDDHFWPDIHVSKLRVCTTWEQAKQKGLIQ